MTKDNYDKVGGLTGMIEDAAERALRGIEPEQDVPLPSASPPKRLIELGALTFVPALAQVNEQGATIRRVVKWQSFNDEQQELLARFDRWRLVVRKGEADGGTVEVAHEALFREWTRLNGWLEPERARLDALRSLEVDTATWDRNGQDAAFLNHRDKRLADPRQHARAGRAVALRDLRAVSLVAVLPADRWGDVMLVSAFRPRMVCTRCGIVGADARADGVRPRLPHGP